MDKLLAKIIATIRESFIGSEIVYTRGSCYRFHLILKAIYPDAVAYVTEDCGHVATLLYDQLWDIYGEISSNPHYEFEDFHRASEEEIEQCATYGWDLSCQGWECPNCDDILTYDEMVEGQHLSQHFLEDEDGELIKRVAYFKPQIQIILGR